MSGKLPKMQEYRDLPRVRGRAENLPAAPVGQPTRLSLRGRRRPEVTGPPARYSVS